MGLLFGLLRGVQSSGAAFNPADLFTGVRTGWLRYPNAADSVFQLADGTTAATADGDPVGYVKDFGPGEWHLTNSNTPTKGVLRVDAGGIRSVEINNSASSKRVYATGSHVAVTGSFTWYIACKTPSSAAGGLYGVASDDASLTDPVFLYPSAGDLSLRAKGTIYSQGAISIAADTPYILKMVYNSTSGEVTYGVVGGASATVSASPVFMTETSTLFWGSDGGSQTSRVAFDQFINAVLTEQETTDLETWLTDNIGTWAG